MIKIIVHLEINAILPSSVEFQFSVSISWKLVYQPLPLSGEVCGEEEPCDQNKFSVNVLVRIRILDFFYFLLVFHQKTLQVRF